VIGEHQGEYEFHAFLPGGDSCRLALQVKKFGS
jgi:hypothetical protein